MILTKRGGSDMYIDMKEVKTVPKVFVDALERQLDRAMRMVPAQDVLNMHLQSGNYAEYDRSDASADLIRRTQAQLAENQTLIDDLKNSNSQLINSNTKLSSEIEELRVGK